MTPLLAHGITGLALPLGVGIVLGLLGGGGSILALPIFLYVFQVPTKSAVAMSLAVVGMSAFVGFLGHWRQGTVSLRVALPFGGFAMLGAFVTARLAHYVPERVQLTLFMIFALSAAVLMLRDAAKPSAGGDVPTDFRGAFSPLLAVQAIGVGALTSLIGAGGGFVIVPALVLLARVPVKVAVGSSLLIITMNALSGFVGYMGTHVPIDWPLVGGFTTIAAIGALLGTRLVRYVPQRRIKQGFAVLILVLGAYVIARSLGLTG